MKSIKSLRRLFLGIDKMKKPSKKEMIEHCEREVRLSKAHLADCEKQLKRVLKNPSKSPSENQDIIDYLNHYIWIHKFELKGNKAILNKTKKSTYWK